MAGYVMKMNILVPNKYHCGQEDLSWKFSTKHMHARYLQFTRMKKAFIVIFLCITFNCLGIAQRNDYNFDLPCDTLTTQTEMNFCTYKKFQIIDSLINQKYNCILFYLDSSLSVYANDQEMKIYYSDIINSVKLSQSKWTDMFMANASIYGNFYKGGSMSSMVANLSAITDGQDRLRKLDEILELMGQDIEIINCR